MSKQLPFLSSPLLQDAPVRGSHGSRKIWVLVSLLTALGYTLLPSSLPSLQISRSIHNPIALQSDEASESDEMDEEQKSEADEIKSEAEVVEQDPFLQEAVRCASKAAAAEKDPINGSAVARKVGIIYYGKQTARGYKQALAAYEIALKYNPSDETIHGYRCQCHLELGKVVWDATERVRHYAQALLEARECSSRKPQWSQAYTWQETAESELLKVGTKWKSNHKSSELEPSLMVVLDGASNNSCEATLRQGVKVDPATDYFRMRLQALRDQGHETDETQDRETRNTTAAQLKKADGNAAYAGKKYRDAVHAYTQALEQDPLDHVFYSNRAASYIELEDFEKGLHDANRCIKLNPQFGKGYSRKAHALFNMGRYDEMEAAATAGLAVDPSSAPLKDLLKQAQEDTKESPEVQRLMFQLRQQEKQKEKRRQELEKTLGGNTVGGGPIFVNSGDDLNKLLSMGGGGGMGGLDGIAPRPMTTKQMRDKARAMAAGASQNHV